jgi:hypothetical protein
MLVVTLGAGTTPVMIAGPSGHVGLLSYLEAMMAKTGMRLH